MSAVERNYVATVAANTWWNLVQFAAGGVIGVAVSVLTARYLGSAAFGVLSYVIWLTAVVATFTDLGFEQLIRRYVPGWFHRPASSGWAARLVWTAVAVQIVMAGAVIAALAMLYPWWSRSLTFTFPRLQTIVIIGLVSVFPLIVSRSIGAFLRSIQSTKPVAVATVATQAANLALVAAAVWTRLDVLTFVWIALLANSALAGALVFAFRRASSPTRPSDSVWPAREMKVYAVIGYGHVILQYIVWTRSEVFFLGIYSPAREIGFYSLAFGVAGLLGSSIGVLQQSLFAAQFELLAGGEEDRSDRLASFSVKYLALLFLPLFLLSWLFIGSAVNLMYGRTYATVAAAFPFLVFGMVVANVLNPVTTKISLSNRKFAATLLIALFGAVMNVGLDMAIIPRHHALGAAIASCISQLLVVCVSVLFVARVAPVRVERWPIAAIVLVNAVLGGLVWLALQRDAPVPVKVALVVVAGAVYLRWLAAWRVFGRADVEVVSALHEWAPAGLKPAFHAVRGYLLRFAAA